VREEAKEVGSPEEGGAKKEPRSQVTKAKKARQPTQHASDPTRPCPQLPSTPLRLGRCTKTSSCQEARPERSQSHQEEGGPRSKKQRPEAKTAATDIFRRRRAPKRSKGFMELMLMMELNQTAFKGHKFRRAKKITNNFSSSLSKSRVCLTKIKADTHMLK